MINFINLIRLEKMSRDENKITLHSPISDSYSKNYWIIKRSDTIISLTYIYIYVLNLNIILLVSELCKVVSTQ